MMKWTKAILALLLALSAGLLSACGNRHDSVVIVAGSTSVQPYAEVLAEGYAHLRPDKIIDVQGGGSSAGIMAVESGAADIGMSSRALKESEQGVWSVEIAKDGLAIIVHPSNPIKDLSLEQVRAVYTASVSDWSELGGRAGEIHVIAREEGSGTRSAFEDLAMAGEPITPRAIVQDSNGAVRQLVSNDPRAIGFISLGLVDDTVEALDLDGVSATWENVMNDSYTLYRPFLFIAAHEPTDLGRQFIEYTLSPAGQQLLIHEGLVPAIMPESEAAPESEAVIEEAK